MATLNIIQTSEKSTSTEEQTEVEGNFFTFLFIFTFLYVIAITTLVFVLAYLIVEVNQFSIVLEQVEEFLYDGSI